MLCGWSGPSVPYQSVISQRAAYYDGNQTLKVAVPSVVWDYIIQRKDKKPHKLIFISQEATS